STMQQSVVSADTKSSVAVQRVAHGLHYRTYLVEAEFVAANDIAAIFHQSIAQPCKAVVARKIVGILQRQKGLRRTLGQLLTNHVRPDWRRSEMKELHFRKLTRKILVRSVVVDIQTDPHRSGVTRGFD